MSGQPDNPHCLIFQQLLTIDGQCFCSTSLFIQGPIGVFLPLQAFARGYLARCEYRRRLAECKAIQDAALMVIKPWARTAIDRLRFIRLR